MGRVKVRIFSWPKTVEYTSIDSKRRRNTSKKRSISRESIIVFCMSQSEIFWLDLPMETVKLQIYSTSNHQKLKIGSGQANFNSTSRKMKSSQKGFAELRALVYKAVGCAKKYFARDKSTKIISSTASIYLTALIYVSTWQAKVS